VYDKAAYDELPDGVLVADADGRVVLLNPSGQRILGRTADETIGRDYREVLPLQDAQGRDWWVWTRPYDGLTTRIRQPEQLLTLQDAGGDRDVLVTAAYVRDGDRQVSRLVVCLRDTSARSRNERSGAELVSTVAHELRSPLTSVKGFTATLLAKWHRFNDDQKRVMLETVNADADRVTRLITELLDVSRIEAGRLEMRRQVVDVIEEVRKVVKGRVVAGEPAARFQVEVLGELPEMWLDPDKVDQILGNLVENAVRHGAGTVTIVVEPDSRKQGAVVSVRDEGEGIPPESVPRVFRQFWRGHGQPRGGTGLGLYIVKGLVEAHGGAITVRRAPSGGAEFRFSLPAGAPDFA
jgi:PAS domain S-box-containing protein